MTTQVVENENGLLDRLGDPEQAQAIFSDPEKAKAFAADLKAAQEKKYADILNQAKEQNAAQLAQALKERDEVSRPVVPANRSKHYNAQADGASVDGITESRGEFYAAVYDRQRDEGLRAKAQQIRNSASTTVPADGGFLVPEEYRADLMETALEASVVRSRAVTIPMSTSRVKIPVIDDTSHASTTFGGVSVAWTSEEALIADSQPKFGEITLDAQKLTAMVLASSELVQDSAVSLAGVIDRILPQAIAFKEDTAFLRGTGAGEPLGILNAGAKVTVAKETGQAADTIVWENLVKMYSRLLPGSAANAVWVANPDTFPELATMALSVGTGGSAIWLQNGVGAPPLSILGLPVIFSEKMSTVGDEGDIALIDFNYYMVGDRQVMTADTSMHYKFANDQIAYRFIERVDGRPSLLSALTPAQGSSTKSAYITLAARA